MKRKDQWSSAKNKKAEKEDKWKLRELSKESATEKKVILEKKRGKIFTYCGLENITARNFRKLDNQSNSSKAITGQKKLVFST